MSCIPKQSCIRCHFFINTTIGGDNTRWISGAEESHRKKALENDFSWKSGNRSLNCHLGVWDEGVGSIETNLRERLLINRRNKCFFWEYDPKMLLPAAIELQKRSDEYRQASKTRILMIIGLWIAGFGLLLTAFLGIYKLFGKCP